MGTTPLFVEQIVIGLQGALWIALVAAVFVDRQVLADWAPHLKDWAILVTVTILSMVYTLGLTLERLFGGLAVLLRLRAHVSRIPLLRSTSDTAHNDDLMKLYEITGILTPYFQYVVVRTRISLAMCFNAPLITLGFLLHIDWQMRCGLVVFVLLLGATVTAVSILTYVSFVETLEARGRQVLKNSNIRLAG